MSTEQTAEIEPVLRKRPKFVWIISIFCLFSTGWTILSFFLIYSGLIPPDEVQKSHFNSQDILVITVTLIMGLLNILGAILLFLLRRHAFHCFVTAFACGILLTVYNMTLRNWTGTIDGPEVLRPLSGWFIYIIGILYSNKLMNDKILN